MFLSAQGKQHVMSSPNSCVVVCVNVLGWGRVDVRSTQNSCVVVCVNVLGWGQMEVSRGENIGCFSWLSSILSIGDTVFQLLSFFTNRCADSYLTI